MCESWSGRNFSTTAYNRFWKGRNVNVERKPSSFSLQTETAILFRCIPIGIFAVFHKFLRIARQWRLILPTLVFLQSPNFSMWSVGSAANAGYYHCSTGLLSVCGACAMQQKGARCACSYCYPPTWNRLCSFKRPCFVLSSIPWFS